MKLLIIGGTWFVGRHLVEAALARGHEVTLFNRGTHASAARDVETIAGDRYTDIATLRGRRWDVVVDTCGYVPRAVTAAAEVLCDAVERYVFISSQSVYADVSMRGVDETAPLKQLTAEQLDEANKIGTEGQPSYGALYGGLKALCEQAAEQAMPNRVLIVRPGLIVGPQDYTDRFTYWVVRVARGGEVLAPGRPERPVQFIDARDLAEWTVAMSERREAGVFNANRLPDTVTMLDVLDQCKSSSGSDAVFTWVSEAFLHREQVAAWSQMPLWLPEEDAPQLSGFMFVNVDKAIAAGLRIRPLGDTVRDTLTWARKELSDGLLKAGIDAEREQALLRKCINRSAPLAWARNKNHDDVDVFCRRLNGNTDGEPDEKDKATPLRFSSGDKFEDFHLHFPLKPKR
jgi:2'-hydroxyisoflavone reductase